MTAAGTPAGRIVRAIVRHPGASHAPIVRRLPQSSGNRPFPSPRDESSVRGGGSIRPLPDDSTGPILPADVSAWRDAYLGTSAASPETRAAFLAIARERGFTVAQRGGLLMARDTTGRVVGWLDTYPRDVTPPETAPAKPCAGCGAAPVGTYHDGSPRYRCGPHPVTYAEETR